MVRQTFFLAMLALIPVAMLAALLWAFGCALVSLFSDWRLGKELDQLAGEGEARREQRRQVNEQRLAGVCDHDFETGAFGLPQNVCYKCGLEKEKPPGPCDHVWCIEQGPVPSSACEKCGKTFSQSMSR